jgi:Domain of unknown function (DUF4282)
MWDFLSFDTFITPKIIRAVFALGLLLIAIATLIRVILGLWQLSLLTGVILPLIGACVVVLLWRIYCELILVFFDIRDKLADLASRPHT